MQNIFNKENDAGTVFRDVIFLIMITFIILFLVAVMHVNPIADPKEESTVPPGNVVVNIFWDDNKNIDVDLWVMAPGDKTPVGYSNRAGQTFNLLRDDLGTYNDETGLNYENAYSRGIPDGEYIINLHMFSHKEKDKTWPVTVTVEVILMSPENSKNARTNIFTGKVNLTKQNEEITAVRFQTEGKILVKDSINRIEKRLRTTSPGTEQRDTEWIF